MKTVRTLIATMVAMLAFASLSTAAATAHEWQVKKQKLIQSVKVTSKSFMWLATVGEKYGCEFQEEGTVGPGAVGAITGVTTRGLTKSKNIVCNKEIELGEYCEKVYPPEVKVEAIGLPWDTELVTVEGQLSNKIVSPAKPEWKFTCKSGKGTFTNECPVVLTATVKNGLEGAVEHDSGVVACSNTGRAETEGEGLLQTIAGEAVEAI